MRTEYTANASVTLDIDVTCENCDHSYSYTDKLEASRTSTESKEETIRLVHLSVNDLTVFWLQGNCQIPGLGAKGQDLAILSERVSVGLFPPPCTS